jgi:GNAT superfamily N-acetyltransferase
MAVAPELQREGVGRDLVRDAIAVARAWPRQAIRLDAHDAPAGAGGFYAKCGFREVRRVTYRTVPLIYFELPL